MILAIFGGTGRTGQHLIEQALEAGHTLHALARSPAKLSIHHDRLQVIPGSLQDKSAVEMTVSSSDTVISVLGPATNQPVYEVSRGTRVILEAMQKQGLRRIILTAGAAVSDPQDTPRLFNRMMNALVKASAKYVYEDMVRTVDILRQSDQDWTVVRVPMLVDTPPTGQIRVGMVGKGAGARLSRADLAHFLLQQVESDQYLRRAPAISN